MLRRTLVLVPWFALVLGAVAPSPAEAQKKPSAALGKVDGRAKLDALIASVLKKQDQQATALGVALAKSAQDLEGPAKKALAKAGIDVTQAQIDLEAAQKELDASVRAKRLSEVSDKHKAALAAAMGATKSLVAPALAKLAPAASNAGALPADGWVYLGTPPSAPGKPYTYESVSAPLPAPGLIVHTRRDVSELGIYVVSSYAGDAAPFGGFVQSFTVPAGVKAFDVAVTIRASGYAKLTALAFGYAYAELRASLVVSGPDGECTADQSMWDHRGAVVDILSESISADAQLVCRVVRGDSTVAATYQLAGGVTQRAGAGGIAAAMVDTDGTGSSSAAGYPYRVLADAFRWRNSP